MVHIYNIDVVGGLLESFAVVTRDRTRTSITRVGTQLKTHRFSELMSNAVVVYSNTGGSNRRTSSSSSSCSNSSSVLNLQPCHDHEH